MAKTSTSVRKPSKAETAKLAAANQANLETPTADKHEITEEQRHADRRADDIAKKDAMAQFVAQQEAQAAAPALVTPPDLTAEFNKELAALQAKFGVTAKVTVKPAKPTKLQSNGFTRPGAETACGKIWATADDITAQQHGAVCAIAALKEHPAMKGINDHTIKTQYARWRGFNGVTGRLPRIHAVHQTAGEYPEAAHAPSAPVVPTGPAEITPEVKALVADKLQQLVK